MKNIALVTGATSELGRHVIDELVSQGWGIIAASKEGEWHGVDDENVIPIRLDVEQHEVVVSAVSRGLAYFGRIDALINIPELDEEVVQGGDFTRAIQSVFQQGVASGLNATLALVPLFRHQGYGAVVQVLVESSRFSGPLASAWQVVRCVAERMTDLMHDSHRGLNVAVRLSEVEWQESASRLQGYYGQSNHAAVGTIVHEAWSALNASRAQFQRGSALTPAQYRWLDGWKNR